MPVFLFDKGYIGFMARSLVTSSALFVFGLTSLAIGAGPITGVWHGTAKYDFTKLPETLSAKQKEYVKATYKKAPQAKLTLTLNGNGTYRITTAGISPIPPPVSGKWKQDSKTVTLQTVKDNKPLAPVIFTFDKSGKSFSFSNGPLTMTFSR